MLWFLAAVVPLSAALAAPLTLDQATAEIEDRSDRLGEPILVTAPDQEQLGAFLQHAAVRHTRRGPTSDGPDWESGLERALKRRALRCAVHVERRDGAWSVRWGSHCTEESAQAAPPRRTPKADARAERRTRTVERQEDRPPSRTTVGVAARGKTAAGWTVRGGLPFSAEEHDSVGLAVSVDRVRTTGTAVGLVVAVQPHRVERLEFFGFPAGRRSDTGTELQVRPRVLRYLTKDPVRPFLQGGAGLSLGIPHGRLWEDLGPIYGLHVALGPGMRFGGKGPASVTASVEVEQVMFTTSLNGEMMNGTAGGIVATLGGHL